MLPEIGYLAVALALLLFGFGAALGGATHAASILLGLAVLWGLFHFWLNISRPGS